MYILLYRESDIIIMATWRRRISVADDAFVLGVRQYGIVQGEGKVSAESVAQRASWEASPLSASQLVWGRLGADGAMWSKGLVPRP